MKQNIVIDIETTANYSIIGLYYPDEDRFQQIPYNKNNALEVLYILSQYDNVIGFNICSFDLPHMHILSNTVIDPHTISHMLINETKDYIDHFIDKKTSTIVDTYRYNQHLLPRNIIDIREIARIHSRTENGNADLHKSSLKYFTAVYLNRIIKEFSSFHKHITDEEKNQLLAYNREDLLATWEIYKKINHVVTSQRAIGTTFNLNATCSTNSRLIIPLLKTITGKTNLPAIEQPYGKLYDDRFKDEPILLNFLNLYDAIQNNTLNKSTMTLPLFDNLLLTIGLGGLHGLSEKIQYPNIVSDDTILVDFDIVSQYPTLYTQLDGIFHESISSTLRQILDDRKRMKANKGCKSTIDAYKLILNGVYGKTNCVSKGNVLYNPLGMYRVATAGQLQILYTILKMKDLGYTVVYVNTDGFTILIPRSDESQIPHIKNIVSMLVNRFFSNVEIELSIFDRGVFFNVNSYALVEKGTGVLKTKKDFATLLSKSTPNVIPKILLNDLLDIQQPITLEDYIAVKTSKHGFHTGNKVSLLYFCKEETDTIIMGNYSKHILSIDDLIADDIDKTSYEKRAEELCDLSKHFVLSEKEKEILESDEYYVPCKKSGGAYLSFRHAIYFDDVKLHNRYVVYNRPNKKCNYSVLSPLPITTSLRNLSSTHSF